MTQRIEPSHEVADAFWKAWRENGESGKHGYYESTWIAINAALAAQQDSHALQAEGKHPAPCARHCEATAFQIEIRNLKAQLAAPVAAPVPAAWICIYNDGEVEYTPLRELAEAAPTAIPLYRVMEAK